jgi:hypothetical protein
MAKIVSVPLIYIALLLLVLGIEANGQNPTRDIRAIAKVKALSVSKLESKLPTLKFENWFADVVGGTEPTRWEVNDCGEQNGSGKQRDFPICVQAFARTDDRIEVTIMVVVGTYKRGVVGKPAVWGIWAQPHNEVSNEIRELSDLVKELARLKRAKN